VILRGRHAYNHWRDADHPRGIYRAPLTSLSRREPRWETPSRPVRHEQPLVVRCCSAACHGHTRYDGRNQPVSASSTDGTVGTVGTVGTYQAGFADAPDGGCWPPPLNRSSPTPTTFPATSASATARSAPPNRGDGTLDKGQRRPLTEAASLRTPSLRARRALCAPCPRKCGSYRHRDIASRPRT
jgi:hypothetical protein